MSPKTLFVFIATLCFVECIVRRQAEEDLSEESDFESSIWDSTVRDKFKFCNTMGSFTASPEQYCDVFNKCCSMQFDPNNGDKCKVKDQRCVPQPNGKAEAVCIHRNCTEMITTTTTTTETPVIEEENTNGLQGEFY
uniref:Ixostatin n=1 Tax=Heterorhabditis bacteriophora TaxID=37862 RepID=A0A1I7XI78_HETBA